MTDSLVLRLGTRKSPLARAQSGHVAKALEQHHPGVRVELVPIVTRGDQLPGDLSKHGGKGLFTAELERGLLDGDLDLAVHSLKDLPVTVPDGLVIAAHPPRVDPRDALISDQASDLDGLPSGAVLMTGSLRRQALLRAHRSDLRVVPIRGNVGTRVATWRASGHAGTILAAAGLARLDTGSETIPAHPLDPTIMIPAPGQGILAVQVRSGGRAEPLCRALDDASTARAARCERHVVAALGADCTLPLAAWATEATTTHGEATGSRPLRLTAALATPDGQLIARGLGEGDDPEAVAEACLDMLRRNDAEAILARIRA